MPNLPPPIDLLPDPSAIRELPPPSETDTSPKVMRRPVLFAAAFLAGLVISLAYVWLREPVYQATASLLTVAPPEIDQLQAEVKANLQHVTVQRQTLLGVPLLEEILRRLSEDPDATPATTSLTVDDLRTMLSVEPVPETNVVELRARGPRAAVLAPVVNTWIDAYQGFRERSVRENKDSTSAALEEEFEGLGRKIEAKRRELDQFRRAHDILSKKDTDNQAMARLNGLNTALNKASDEEVLAKTRLSAIKEAIAKGEPVVPPSEQKGLEGLQKRAQELREQVKDLRRRYTPQYVALQPQLKLIPEQLEQTEAAIRQMLADGKRAALSEAEQAYASARQSVQEIRRQINEHKREAAEFTARFTEHEALVADLQQLELLYRQTQARLVQIGVKLTEKYPQLQVVDYAYPPSRPLWPNYWRDSGIALAGSLGTALVVLMIYDYLVRRERPFASFKLPDIRIFSVSEDILLRRQQENIPTLPREEAVPALSEDTTPALAEPVARELAEPEIRLLLDAADLKARQLLGLLLSGVTLEEAAELGMDNFDLEGSRLLIGGGCPRGLILAPRLKAWLSQAEALPAWLSATKMDADELAALVACAAVDAGVSQPESIEAGTLRHTYIMYLVRQGIRLADLERIVGRLPARELARYARFSPPGPGLRADAVPLIHPVLRATNGSEAAAL
jgi:succinoglycan biosynthesis transport protein ExoP